jgi:integrase
MPESNRKAAMFKVPRPNGFPLFVHKSGKFGRWCKKIRQRFHYFGPVDPNASDYGAQAALEKWLDEKDALLAGRVPRPQTDDLTIKMGVNAFLTAKRQLVDGGELVERTWTDYHATCGRLLAVIDGERPVDDLRPRDFETLRRHFAKTRGPVALGNEIARAKILLKWVYDSDLIDRPVKYGQSFKRPSRKALREVRNRQGPRMFTAEEIRSMLTTASVQLKAMILLGINGGLGNADVANIPRRALDLKNGWLDYPRPKTGVARRVPLWSETVEALRVVLDKRRKPKNKADAGIVFVTKYGARWAKETADSPVSKETAKLLTGLGIKRPGVGFYCLRRTFQTIADEARDPLATKAIMGHAEDSSDMSAVYRQGISDERLQAVVDHVHNWLWPAV